jgi:competence protein ComEC
MPLVTWRVGPPHWLAVVAYYVALTATWMLRRRVYRGPQRVTAVATIGAAGWILFKPADLLDPGDGLLRVTFIDVGQGDATLVRLPRGTTLLVDAGGANSGSFDIGDRVVGAVMRDAGVRRLETAVVTHGDADHLGGLGAVTRDFRPREIWEGIPVPRAGPIASLRTRATAHGARWTNVQTNDRFAIDGVDLIVHHPGVPDWERQEVRNDDSVVLELRWRDVSIVLTGDIGRDTERAIADRFEPAGIRIIKVPHHGSLTSSSVGFLEKLLPRVAVFSVGRSNTFGHPAPEVVRRYHSIGAQIFRTDRDGAISLETDGYSVDVQAWVGRRLRVN